MEQAVRDRLNLRIRRLAADVPATLLRKGVNVLAIEIQRVSDHPDFKIDSRGGMVYMFPGWGSVGLLAFTLTGAPMSAVRPPQEAAGGLRAWNCSALQRVWRDKWVGSPEPVSPVRIVGTRNGVFAGQVVLGSRKPIRRLTAQVSDLSVWDGRNQAAIPAAALVVRYPSPWLVSPPRLMIRPPPPGPALLDTLLDKPPETVPPDTTSGWAIQPVWLTVKIPPTATPGRYTGRLTVSAENCTQVEVPIVLDVAGFALPAIGEMSLRVDMVQFPDAVAAQYNVPLWSDKHFELMGRSLRLAGLTGNRVVYIPLICDTIMSNNETMVRWVRNANGGFTHDYSLAEQYLDLVERQMGRPEIVCLWVWGPHLAERARRMEGDRAAPEGKVAVTLLNTATGKTEKITGPAYEDPSAKDFWRPAVEGLVQRLKQRGLDKAVVLAAVGDRVPAQPVFDCWAALLPDAPWRVVAHHPAPRLAGRPVTHRACAVFDIWCGSEEQAKRPAYSWRNPWALMHCRSLELYAPLTFAQAQGELAIQSGFGGIGWLSADFWPKLAERGRYPGAGDIYGRTFFDQNPVLGVGPDGAASTVRREIFVEGIQLAEAVIFLDKCLSDDRVRATINAEMVQRCRAILTDRGRRVAWSCAGYHPQRRPIDSKYHSTMEVPQDGVYWHISSDWQERALELFRIAAEVQAIVAR